MRISEESIKEVLYAADIVEVIGEYVSLKQSGKNYFALCPFHKEKTPSFTVNRERGLFHCFGCGVGGNVVSFLMKIEKLTFFDAIETLAKKFSIKLKYEGGYYQDENKEIEKLYEYSSITAQFFHNNLLNTNEGNQALKYLKSRGIDESTVKAFNLGYALSAWDGLLNFIKKNNYDLEIFEQLGLIIKKEDGDYYDRFRGRIIFPIYSNIGKIIAFGGRIITEDNEQPKYLNSPESRIYIKGKTLYGLFQTKEEIRKAQFAILVEGYMDFLSLYQNGIRNVVASAGTSLTNDQIYILSKIAPEINLVFDGDDAGQKAAIRSIQLMLQTEVNFKIISLPEKEDPDSFIRKSGKEKFFELIEDGKNYIDYVYSLALNKKLLNDPNSKLKVIDSLIEYTARVRDPLRRELFARDIARKFNVSENSVLQKLGKYVKNFIKTEERQTEFQIERESVNNAQNFIKNISPLEKGLIKLVCEVDHIHLDPIFAHIEEQDFSNPLVAEIFSVLKKFYLDLEGTDKIDIQIVINKLEKEELKSVFSDALVEKYKVSKGWLEVEGVPQQEGDLNKMIMDYIKKIKIISLTQRIDTLKQKVINIDDINEKNKILEEIQGLIKLRNTYQNMTL